jgi:hypothetical protein
MTLRKDPVVLAWQTDALRLGGRDIRELIREVA